MQKDQSKRVRAIIVKDGMLLTIRRTKTTETYWVLPGGGIEDGETPQQALVREVKEETGLDCVIGEYVANYPYRTTRVDHDVAFYRASIKGGVFGKGTGPEYSQPQRYEGSHEAQWLRLSDLSTIDLRPREVRERIVAMFNNGT
ncbi:MAG: NUDIX domain-containing protein [Parcubacteria group bacterium]